MVIGRRSISPAVLVLVKRLDNLQRAIVGAGALVSLVWAFSNLRGMAGFVDAGSGGLGAVSVGIPGDLLLVCLVAIVANVALTPWARRRGRAAIRWRWVHLLTTVGFLGLLVISAPVLTGALGAGGAGSYGGALLILFAILALALPVQVFFAAGFLALTIRRQRPGE